MTINLSNHLTAYSIGYFRESDGDFRLLATLNNHDGELERPEFEALINSTLAALQALCVADVVALEREDTPDYVNID